MYNFDKLTNRRGTNCFKWDEINEGELPMWIADMDFEVAPAIKEGFKNRIENSIYGYTFLGDSFYESYINWWKRRHHFEIKKEWIVFTTGVVPSISSAIRRISEISNNVVVLTPVYNIFFNSIRNNGRDILTCDLIYENGTYIFSGEGLSLDETIINLVDRLETEVNDSESGEAKLYIAPEDIHDPIEDELPGKFSSSLYDWVDEDDPDQERTWYGNDSGDYNVGYDSIFGDN